MRQIDTAVIHCSDSFFGNADIIRQWHLKRGWRDIGYHWVVLNGYTSPGKFDPDMNGRIEAGRPIDNDIYIEEGEVGAHALGYNERSVGICLIGGQEGTKTAFSLPQYWSALMLVGTLKLQIPDLQILGHNETGSPKACPVIDMQLFRERVNTLLTGCLSYKFLKEDIAGRGI